MVNEKRRAVLIDGNGAACVDFGAVLRQAGFAVTIADSATSAAQQVEEAETDIVVLFYDLPDIDANETIRRLRPKTHAHIIALLDSDEEFDVVLALEAGADQYMVRPVSLREFRARINSIMRERVRMKSWNNGAGGEHPDVLRHRDLVLDTSSWDVAISGRQIPVTATEFSLLHILLMAPGRVRSKQEMVRHLNGYAGPEEGYISAADERSIEVHIANLRRKLGDSAREPKWIETIRGVGYRMLMESHTND